MAHLVTVRDVSSPFLGTFEASTSIWETYCTWTDACLDKVPGDPMDHVALVVQNEKPVGWLAFEDLTNKDQAEHKQPISGVMNRLSIDFLITAQTPLLEAAKLFNETSPYVFIVLDGNRLSAWLSYHDLLSLPFRACLFSMLLSIEQGMLDVLRTNSTLSISKLDRRVDLIKRRLRGAKLSWSADSSHVLSGTLFSEKVDVIRSCKGMTALLPSLANTYETRSTRITRSGSCVELRKPARIKQAVDIRNYLAHASEPYKLPMLLPKNDLHAFLSWLGTLENELQQFLNLNQKLTD